MGASSMEDSAIGRTAAVLNRRPERAHCSLGRINIAELATASAASATIALCCRYSSLPNSSTRFVSRQNPRRIQISNEWPAYRPLMRHRFSSRKARSPCGNHSPPMPQPCSPPRNWQPRSQALAKLSSPFPIHGSRLHEPHIYCALGYCALGRRPREFIPQQSLALAQRFQLMFRSGPTLSWERMFPSENGRRSPPAASLPMEPASARIAEFIHKS